MHPSKRIRNMWPVTAGKAMLLFPALCRPIHHVQNGTGRHNTVALHLLLALGLPTDRRTVKRFRVELIRLHKEQS